MDIQDFAVASGLLTLFVVGTVELIKQAFAQNWKAVVTIIGAAAVGGLAGWFFFPVIGLPVGIALGLAGSGFVTTAQNVGKGASSTEV